MNIIPLIGYSDRLSVRPGEVISFKMSSRGTEPFQATLHRSISADPNPEGPGIVEQDASKYFLAQSVSSREQNFYPGSYGITAKKITVPSRTDLVLSAIVHPTLRCDGHQTILALGGAQICLDQSGAATLTLGDVSVSTGSPLALKKWYRIEGRIKTDGTLLISQQPLGYQFDRPAAAQTTATPPETLIAHATVAAAWSGAVASNHFNGKIEAPQITSDGTRLAAWDFSADTQSATVTSKLGPDLTLINFPTRAITSSDWDGSEMCWRHKPAHYAAIHFHDDDIYDFEWQTDFTFKVPDNMPSGVYVMRTHCEGHSDAMPFFVCPPLGTRTAKLCVLVSTFTYTIYGNHGRPDYQPNWQERIKDWNAYPYNAAEYPNYGLSTYNTHSDGSGICHASHKRPLFNLRPGYITFGATPCSGLRHFQADSHLISWLHAKGIDYDIVTDAELQQDGLLALEGYAAVTTGTHPEYHTSRTLAALRDYRDGGGALHYLGGNGFYWRVAQHTENDGLLEIRRAEDGIRAWEAEPGEYYNAFDGTYGGLWRRNGHAPQELVGVGFTAQGEFYGAGYTRKCQDPKFDWVFEGIEGDVLGDFGFSGNGAAGFELDHLDESLGSFKYTTLLAQSIGDRDGFVLVPEEQLTHLTTLRGSIDDNPLTADMIYFEVPGGGSVFSTGSITFCGSLPWNKYDNNISRLLENVLTRSLIS